MTYEAVHGEGLDGLGNSEQAQCPAHTHPANVLG